MAETCLRSIADLRQGVHTCLLYEDSDDPIALVLPFITVGLAAGERCVYVVGDHDPEHILRSLINAGVDVDSECSRGALVLVTRWEASFPDGVFDPAAMIVYVRHAIADAIAAGFHGLRIIAEMTWALQMGVGQNKLIHYEALGNHLYPDEPLVAVCLYNRSRFPAAICQDALRTHPVVALNGQLYSNVYYELPEAVIDGAAATEKLDWMLAQLHSLRQAEDDRIALLKTQAARAQAEAAVQARDEFLSVAAHELKTPVTGLRAYCQLAARRIAREGEIDRAWLAGALGTIERQSVKLERLVAQLLDVTRLDAGRLTVAPEQCDLVMLVKEVAACAQAVTADHVIALRTPPSLEVTVDPLRLEQALTNLLDNAIKYSPDGGQIDVEILQSDHGAVRISVRDRGVGIPLLHRERIFERYYQAHSGFGGIGLGLHISRAIARLHGGDILVDFPQDGGTCFSIVIPSPGEQNSNGWQPNGEYQAGSSRSTG